MEVADFFQVRQKYTLRVY